MADMAQQVFDAVRYFTFNFLHNVENAFDMDLTTFIRLVVVVGAYLLIRPYLVKGGAYLQEREHEKVIAADRKREKDARLSPNDLRGQASVPDGTDSEEEEGEASGPSWGGNARKKQRRELRKKMDAEEKDDRDIMEYLVDYEEGKDGW
jgi:hypothetical protein